LLQATSVAAYAIEETVPAHLTVDKINESGVFDPGTRKAKWVPLETIILTNSPQLWVDLNSVGQRIRFYRVVPAP
jgi:hypothetical protein